MLSLPKQNATCLKDLYLAKAVSIKDLHKRVAERVPQGTAIPSVKWLRYQFQPINPRANTAKYYKGSMEIKMMVQKRQVRPWMYYLDKTISPWENPLPAHTCTMNSMASKLHGVN